MTTADGTVHAPLDGAQLARLGDLQALEPGDLLVAGRSLRRVATTELPGAMTAALSSLAGQDPGAELLTEFDATWADYDATWQDVRASVERGDRPEAAVVASLLLLREDLECLRFLAARLLLEAKERPTPSLEGAWHRMASAANVADTAAEPALDVLQDALDAEPSLGPELAGAFHLSPGDWWLGLADPLLFEARHSAPAGAPLRLAAAGSEPGPVQKLEFEGGHHVLVKRDRSGALWAVALPPVDGTFRWSWVDAAGEVHDEVFAPDEAKSLCCRVDPRLLEDRLDYSGLKQGDRTWLFKGAAKE